MLQLIDGTKGKAVESGEMRGTVLKGDIYNGSDFTARSERKREGGSSAARDAPRAVAEERS